MRRRLVLAICCLSLFLVTMDVTIVNVALPSIRSDLHASVAGLQWAVDAYTVVVASLLIVAGWVADRFGRRRVFQIGLAVFSAGSLLCSVAPSTSALVVCRMVQAVGGAMLNPVAMSIVVETFPDAKERARAIGVWGAVFGVSMAAGPVLGGLLVEHVGWRSIFWVNVPVGLLAIALSARFIPASRVDRARRPLFDLRGLRGVSLARATALAMLSFAAFSGFLFVNSLYLQDARGLTASAAGLVTLPVALGLVISSPLSGRRVAAGRARTAIVVAGTAVSLGALVLTRVANDTPLVILVVAYTMFGVGIGSIGAPVNTTAIASLPPSQAGLASAIASTSRQVGAALGVLLAGSLGGPHAVFSAIVIAGAAVVGVGLSAPWSGPRAAPSLGTGPSARAPSP